MNEQKKHRLMIHVLSEGISRIRGEPKIVQQLYRQPFSGNSSFSTEKIRVRLEDGEWLDLFFKDLNPAGLLDEARIIREVGLERSRREILMYRDILPQLHLDTPKLYGCRLDSNNDLYWLFLENTGPKRLSRLGDFSLWVDAAGWAARLHAVHGHDLQARTDFLPRYDTICFTDCARKLEHRLVKFNARQQYLITKALDRYYRILGDLCALPQHLIHGEFFGKNIMIRPGKGDETIAVIDWETAAFGPRCIDLVSITAGRWTPEQRAAMCKAYIFQYEAETRRQIEMDDLIRELEAVALYRSLWWLSYWSKGDEQHIDRWLKELSAVMNNATTKALCSA